MARMPMPAAAAAMAAPAMMTDDAMVEDTAMMAEDTAMMDETEMAEGYVIEIIVKADGSFAVSKEDLRGRSRRRPRRRSGQLRQPWPSLESCYGPRQTEPGW